MTQHSVPDLTQPLGTGSQHTIVIEAGERTQQAWLQQLTTHRVIAVIRTSSLSQGLNMAQAVAEGGIRLIEVAWNSVEPMQLIEMIRNALPASCVVGAGTIQSLDQLKDAISAGSQFCFSPHTSAPLIEASLAAGVPMIPGALSPTEIVTAWQAGARSVKVFPIQAVGGAAYLRSLKAPLGHIPLIPTGGVTLENAEAMLSAGAIAVGLASDLFPQSAIARQNWMTVTQRTQHLLSRLQLAA